MSYDNRFGVKFDGFTDEEVSEWNRKYDRLVELRKEYTYIVDPYDNGPIPAEATQIQKEIAILVLNLKETCIHMHTRESRNFTSDGLVTVKRHCDFCKAEDIQKINANKELFRLLSGMRQVILQLPVKLDEDSTDFLNDPVWDSYNNRGKTND